LSFVFCLLSFVFSFFSLFFLCFNTLFCKKAETSPTVSVSHGISRGHQSPPRRCDKNLKSVSPITAGVRAFHHPTFTYLQAVGPVSLG
jgi:hypothetical protein